MRQNPEWSALRGKSRQQENLCVTWCNGGLEETAREGLFRYYLSLTRSSRGTLGKNFQKYLLRILTVFDRGRGVSKERESVYAVWNVPVE